MNPKALALICALSSHGCSFALVKGPVGSDARACTSSYAAPIGDTVLTALGFFVAGVAAGLSGLSDTEKSTGQKVVTHVVVPLVFVGVPATSAVYGYSRVRRCAVVNATATEDSARRPAMAAPSRVTNRGTPPPRKG